MNPKPPFAELFQLELEAAFERAGRPDASFHAACAARPGINAKYYERLARKDVLAKVEGARDIEVCAFQHPKIKSHYVRYYSFTALNLHYMEVHARSNERLRSTPQLIEQAERHVAEVLDKSIQDVERYLVIAEQLLREQGLAQAVRYGTGPLLVAAEVVSPYCGSYLQLLMQADRLMSLLEYQRLRRLISNAACDKEFARIDRLLKAVQRAAFGMARGLRMRSQAAVPETAAEAGAVQVPRSPAAPQDGAADRSLRTARVAVDEPGDDPPEVAAMAPAGLAASPDSTTS